MSQSRLDGIVLDALSSVTQNAKSLAEIDGFAGRIGVDGVYLLNTLYEQVSAVDPFWFATTIMPQTLPDILDAVVKHLCAGGLRPVFVFDGLPTRYYNEKEDDSMNVHGSWGKVERTPARDQQDALHRVCPPKFDEEVTSVVIRQLMSRGFEVYTAPFLSWAQLAALKFDKYISGVVGPIELFLFEDFDTVATLGDIDTGAFNYINRQALTAQVETTFPGHSVHKFVALASKGPAFCGARDGLQATPFADALAQQHNYYDEVHFVTQYCPVMSMTQFQCLPLSKHRGNQSCATMREYFGNNIHSSLERPLYFFFLWTNVLSPAALKVLAWPRIIDRAAVIDVSEYRNMLTRIMPLRAQVIYQLLAAIRSKCPDFQNLNITWVREYTQRESAMLPPPIITLDEWTHLESDTEHNFVSVLKFARNASASEEVRYDTYGELLTAVQLKSLDLLGYFTHAAHTPSDDEVSGSSIFAQALEDGGRFPDSSVLLIELIRTKTLTGGHLTLTGSSTGVLGNESEGVNLAIRIMSLVPVSASGPWESEVDPSVLAFLTMVRIFQRTLRSLAEVIAAMLYVKRKTALPLADFRGVGLHLPFGATLDAHAGIIATFILTSQEYSQTTDRLGLLQHRFPQCTNLRHDVLNMRSFFLDTAVTIVARLHEDAMHNRNETAHDHIHTPLQEVKTQVEHLFRL